MVPNGREGNKIKRETVKLIRNKEWALGIINFNKKNNKEGRQ